MIIETFKYEYFYKYNMPIILRESDAIEIYTNMAKYSREIPLKSKNFINDKSHSMFLLRDTLGVFLVKSMIKMENSYKHIGQLAQKLKHSLFGPVFFRNITPLSVRLRSGRSLKIMVRAK